MKKLFTLFALLTCFLGANAKEIVDAEVDFSKMADGSAIKFYGWGASESAKARLSIKDGCLHFESTEATDPTWDCQFHPIGGVSAEADVVYTLHFKVKGSKAENISALGFGQTPYGQFPITTEWVEGTFNYTATAGSDGSAPSGDILMQCGGYVGEFDIAYLKITHEGKEEKPAEWIPVEGLVNGDAESAWPDWSLQQEGGINANWRGDRTPEICAWALTMGRNFDDSPEAAALDNNASSRARPFPADIEVDPTDANNHVFAVHVTEIKDIEGGGDGSVAWSNQFWFQAPKAIKNGTDVKVKFRYRADAAADVSTQMHRIHPSHYLNGNGVGTLNFTKEWQECEKVVTWATDGWSIAFNLTANNHDPNVYYFDDISFEVMKLEEGWFVAASNTENGIEYDYDTATELVYDADEDAYVATVGTEGNKDSWVNEVMISTVRGNDKAFKNATIKPSGTIKTNDPENWQDYTAGSSAKIKLPAAGVWKIFVGPSAEDAMKGQILFMQVEGEAEKEPVAIVMNTEEIVIDAVERQPTSSEEEGGSGNTWDNQFFLYSNRNLAPGEVTIIEFEYKATKEANSSVAFQGIVAGKEDYITGAFNLQDDTAFGTDWKSIKKELTMPATKWDGTAVDAVKFLTFDLACIKEANTYTFRNIKWYLKGDVNEEGKTLENLINETGTENFAKKIGAGTSPVPTGIETVVTKTTGSAVIYNLAGQRVSKDYKGIVVKNGKKVVVK